MTTTASDSSLTDSSVVSTVIGTIASVSSSAASNSSDSSSSDHDHFEEGDAHLTEILLVALFGVLILIGAIVWYGRRRHHHHHVHHSSHYENVSGGIPLVQNGWVASTPAPPGRAAYV